MHVIWEPEVWEAFKENDRPGPIHMLNLLRYREKANYPDGRDVTGKDAYAEYGRLSAPIFQRLGGRIVWRGRPEQTTIGPPHEEWDLAFIAEYPGPSSFVAMLGDPDYRIAVRHRRAALLDSRLVRMAPLPLGATFSEWPRQRVTICLAPPVRHLLSNVELPT